MTSKLDWEGQTGATWAAEVARTDRAFRPLSEILVDRILAKGAAHSILDIGCGAGELSLRLGAAKPGARIVGVDVSPDLVAVATARIPAGSRCSFQLADASTWHDPWFYPDLLVSRHGVMFFDNPPAAFAHLAEHAAERARLVFSCFRSVDENSWVNEVIALLPEPPPPMPHGAAGPFAFADTDHVRGILESGGWGGIAIEPVDFEMTVGSGEDAITDAASYFKRIGPAARAMAAMDEDERSAMGERIRDLAARRLANGEVCFQAAAWIVTAIKKD
jgi:SAM-dependent methyltransferase